MLLLEFHPIFTGHGIYLQQLSRYLRNNNVDVSILAADFLELPANEVVDGLNVYRFKFSHNEKHWEIKLAWRVITFLFRNRNSYDILHIHGHLDIYGLLTLFNRLFHKHTISQMVLLGADDPLTLLKTYRFMKQRYKILSLMDRFLCISKMLCDSYQRAGLPMEKLTYIQQGVDIERFTPVGSMDAKEALKNKLGLAGCQHIVIYVGSIVARKGVDLLIDAWCRVQKQYPGALLLLVGQEKFDDNDVNKVQLNAFVDTINKVIDEERLNVLFAGKKENVNEYLQCADVFVLPSRKEGFGNVILEAMASGLPVVVTFMDGVALETVVHGQNGFIVQTVDELFLSLAQLLGDTALRTSMGEAGVKMALDKFSMEFIAGRYAELYRDILGYRHVNTIHEPARINVAYLIDTISCDTAGTQKQLLETISRLDTKLFSPHLLCLWQSEWMKRNSLPCPYTVLGYKGFLSFSFPSVLFRLRSFVTSKQIHIIQTFFVDSIFVAYFAGALLRPKPLLVSSRRDMGLGEQNQPWYHKIFKLLLPFVNKSFSGIIANSEQVRQYVATLEKTPLEKISVMRNGVSLPQASGRLPAVYRSNQSDLWIGLIASLTPVKRHDVLLQAVALLREKALPKSVRVVLLGEGPERDSLEKLSSMLKLEDVVHFLGAVQDVTDYVGNLDICVLCSDREGLSNAILEYMACGKPVIATAVGGNVELIDCHNGILVPPDDPQALAEALEELVMNEGKRHEMGLRALEKVEEKYIWKSSMACIESYYRKMVGAP